MAFNTYLSRALLGLYFSFVEWVVRRDQLKSKVEGNQSSHTLDSKDVDDVVPSRGVSLGREQKHAFALGWLLGYGKLDARLNAGVLVQKVDDFAPFSLDVALELATADWEVIEQVLDNDRGPLVARHHGRALQLARSLKFELLRLGSFLLRACNDRELREGTQRRQGLASEPEGLEGREVGIAGQLGGVVLESKGLVVLWRYTIPIVLDLYRV